MTCVSTAIEQIKRICLVGRTDGYHSQFVVAVNIKVESERSLID